MSHAHRNSDNVSEMIAAFLKAPRTVREVMDMVGCSKGTARFWVASFQRSGLLRVRAFRPPSVPGPSAAVYEWQSTPFAQPDFARVDE